MSEIRVNTIVAAEGTSAPRLPYGVSVPTGMGITGAGGVNITGVVTAANIDGTLIAGSAINSAGVSTVGILTVTKDARIGAAVTVDGAATVTGALTGSTGTFSGAVNIDATTDSTSTTTGALIVDGGAAIAKNVYIGAGLSVAGTLTYEDVTSVDSVGMVTAKSGVNVSGGQLQVGVAYSVGAAGVATAKGFVAGTSGFVGDVTGDLTGTVNTAAQTSITSVGTLAGLTVGSAGEFKVGTAVTISSTAGVSTFSQDVFFHGANDTKYVHWDASSNKLLLKDGAYLGLGNAGNGDLQLYHDGTDSIINNATGDLKIYVKDGEEAIVCKDDEGVEIYYNDVKKFETTNDGAVITGMTTTSAGMTFNGMLKEEVETTAGKLSDNTNIDIADGMIHFFTTQETTTCTPNFRFNSSYSLQNKMAIGQAISVTVITTAAAGGYSANWTIDGNAVTEQWNGGSAPAEGGSDGYDMYSFTIIKTADATGDSGFKVFGNLSNFT